tara:strand:+ start:2159 stop:2509 length:351 start_codon:yes stop_codon:yes gene_type:complete
MTINIKPSGEACGAEITGVDLTGTLSDEEIKSIREAWLSHHVLSFPEQAMSDDDLERFTLCFGCFGDDPFIAPITGRNNIVAVKRTADEKFLFLLIIGTQIGASKKTLQLAHVFLA